MAAISPRTEMKKMEPLPSFSDAIPARRESRLYDPKPGPKGELMGTLTMEQKLMRELDIDGDGNLSEDELVAAAKRMMGQQKETQRWRSMGLAMIGVVFALIGVMFAVTLGANEASKETHAKGAALVGIGNQSKMIVQTATSAVAVPLLVAPILPKDLKIESLTVSYDINDEMSVTETFKIASMKRVNDTYMTLVKAADEGKDGVVEVRIWNADTTALLKDGQVVDVCALNTGCSALKVHGAEDAKILEQKAIKSLEDAGFIDAAATDENGNIRKRILVEHPDGGDHVLTYEDEAFLHHLSHNPEHEKTLNANQRKLLTRRKTLANFGCCSMKLGFLLGGSDTADCGKGGAKKLGKKQKKQNKSNKISKTCCQNHDNCLHKCKDDRKDNCNCWGACDKVLHACSKGSCMCKKWWDAVCWASALAVRVTMSMTPNGC